MHDRQFKAESLHYTHGEEHSKKWNIIRYLEKFKF